MNKNPWSQNSKGSQTDNKNDDGDQKNKDDDINNDIDIDKVFIDPRSHDDGDTQYKDARIK